MHDAVEMTRPKQSWVRRCLKAVCSAVTKVCTFVTKIATTMYAVAKAAVAVAKALCYFGAACVTACAA